MTLSAYVPIVALFVLSGGFVLAAVALSTMVGPRRYNRARQQTYESGIEPSPQPAGGGRLPVKYYVTAMLFIIFDIEIIFLYPWAVGFDNLLGSLGLFALVEMILFVLTVLIAFAYVWRRGGLDWD